MKWYLLFDRLMNFIFILIIGYSIVYPNWMNLMIILAFIFIKYYIYNIYKSTH